jgi:hypothetical protein
MFHSYWIPGGCLLLSAAACSSQDPGALAFAAARGNGRGASAGGSVDAGARSAATPPATPPNLPPPIVATDASAGVRPPDDASPPPADPNGSCASPKCGATSDGCGCVAPNGQGDIVFLGCNGQGCVCGHGQTVEQQLDVTTACDSDADTLAAWQMCTCP